MRKTIMAFVGLFFFISPLVQASAEKPEGFVTKDVIILGSFVDYAAAKQRAIDLAKATGIAYSDRGMVWDAKRGLIYPDNLEDDLFAGQYAARRAQFDCNEDSEHCLSVERSDLYEGFKKGLYIVVGGVMDLGSVESAQLLARYKKNAPDAYIKKTDVYMGCRR